MSRWMVVAAGCVLWGLAYYVSTGLTFTLLEGGIDPWFFTGFLVALILLWISGGATLLKTLRLAGRPFRQRDVWLFSSALAASPILGVLLVAWLDPTLRRLPLPVPSIFPSILYFLPTALLATVAIPRFLGQTNPSAKRFGTITASAATLLLMLLFFVLYDIDTLGFVPFIFPLRGVLIAGTAFASVLKQAKR